MSTAGALLVTGAAGQLGKLVLESLLKNSKNKIIATTRDINKLNDFTSRGVTARTADFSKPETLAKAFEGAERLLLISTDAVGSRTIQHKNAIDAAIKAGVKHIVYTSWVNPDRSLAVVSPEHAETEKLLEKSGVTYTILRNANYAENLLFALPHAIKSGVLAGAQGGGRVAYVTREDCARTAAAALAANENVNAIFDVTGPRAVSYPELAKILEEITGKAIKAVDLPASDFKGALVQSGMPEDVAELLLSFDLAAKQGAIANVSTTVKDLTGLAATDLKDFLIAHKKGFA